MKVSVAIATYKRSRMVKQAVEAALGQTLRPDEVVVTDDASPDDTWAVLEQLASEHPEVRVFRRGTNSGGVENWNDAVRRTSGDYIAWCSDDDRHLPDHLEASVAYLEQHPEIGLVHSGFVDAIETEEGMLLEPRPLRFPQPHVVGRDRLLAYLVRYYDWPFHPSTLVFRREVWETVGAFDARYALADTDWFVRVTERYPTALLARHGVTNRRHPGNWSNRVGSAGMQREIFEIVEGAINRIYAHRPLRRTIWRMLWRWNVRLRLLLTLRQRMRTRHVEAAAAAWEAMVRHTGCAIPAFLEECGDRAIRWWCGRKHPEFESARQSVSPL